MKASKRPYEIDGCWYSNKNWHFRLPSGQSSACTTGQGCITYPPYSHRERRDIQGGQEVYDSKQKWLDRFKQAGYIEENGLLIPPPPKTEPAEAQTETEAEIAVENKLSDVLETLDTSESAAEIGRRELVLAGYKQEKDGWWRKQLGSTGACYRIWPKWNGVPKQTEIT